MTDRHSTQLDRTSWKSRIGLPVAVAIYWALGQIFPATRASLLFTGVICLFISGTKFLRYEKPWVICIAALGLSPIIGWIPSASRYVDPILIFAAISTVESIAGIAKKKVELSWYWIPMLLGSLLGVRHWWSIQRGSTDEIFARLFSGWDHFGHFYLYLNSLRFNTFVAKAPELITQSLPFNRNYPAGIQMNWAQWWPQDIELAQNHPTMLLRSYVTLVLLTAIVCAILISISIARVFENRSSKFLVGMTVSFFVNAMVFAGPLSIAIWNGFPNFLVSITGVSVVGSLIYSPLKSRYLQLVTIFAAISISSYNWYPLLVPVGIAVLAYLIKVIRELSNKERFQYVSLLAVLVVGSAVPVVRTFGFGIEHLTIDGGMNQLPPNMVVAILALSFALGIYDLAQDATLAVNAKFSPMLIAPVFGILVALYVRLNEGGYPYYVQKISMGLVFICLFLLPIRLQPRINQLIELAPSKFPQFLAGPISAIFIGIGAMQLFGYIGPDWQIYAPSSSAIGVTAPDLINKQVQPRLRVTKILTSLSENILQSGRPGRDCFVLDDIDMQDYDPVLTNYWVGVLTWTLTDNQVSKSQNLIPLKTGVPEVEKNLPVVESLLNPKIDCPIVPLKLAQSLVARNKQWADVLWAIDGDGNVSKFRK